MVKFLLKVIILFAIGWFIYAKFWGNEKEKQVASNIGAGFSKMGEGFVQMLSGTKDAIIIEANKGTFQKALEKTTEGINKLNEMSKNGSLKTDFSNRIADLEAKKKDLQQKMEAAKRLNDAAQNEQLKKDFNTIAGEIEQVSKEMEKAKK
jgi:ABC-type phosphate transport system auxiliary subunit